GTLPPSAAWAWRPLMVKVSRAPVPPTEIVAVIVEADTAMLAAVMSLPELKATLPTPGLNAHPFGAVRISVLLLPTAKSPLEADGSAIVISPSAVKPGA